MMRLATLIILVAPISALRIAHKQNQESNFAACSAKIGRFHNDKEFVFTHISKAAGSSAKLQIREAMTDMTPGLVSAHEVCYPPTRKPGSGRQHLTFLRSPRDHVLSQYLECAFDSWGHKVTGGTGLPKDKNFYVGFGKWVNYFTDDWTPKKGDFHCYNPFNFQARTLTCKSAKRAGTNAKKAAPSATSEGRCVDTGKETCCHHVGPIEDTKPNLMQATAAIETMDFIGITELYEESMCLLKYRLTGKLDVGCTCKEPLPESPRLTHKVPPHSVDKIDGAQSFAQKWEAESVSDATYDNHFEDQVLANTTLQGEVWKVLGASRALESLNMDELMKMDDQMIADYLDEKPDVALKDVGSEEGKTTLGKMDELTEIDTQVYVKAVERTLCDLRALAFETKQCIIRKERLAALFKKNEYIKGFSKLEDLTWPRHQDAQDVKLPARKAGTE